MIILATRFLSLLSLFPVFPLFENPKFSPIHCKDLSEIIVGLIEKIFVQKLLNAQVLKFYISKKFYKFYLNQLIKNVFLFQFQIISKNIC